MPISHQTPQKNTPPSFDPQAPALEVISLQYTYPGGQAALDAVSLSISTGEKVALVGPNGSGKSTLLLNLIGILQGSGEVAVSSIPVVEKTLPLIRSRVGYIFQNPDDQLFSPTVYEDVAFGPLHMGLTEDEVHARSQRALEQIGMSDYAQRLSHHLSMGEKKRIAIATVLSMQPEVILLDEPTAGLDPRARRSLIDLLKELPQTLLIATHDLQMVTEILARTIILDEGKLVANGLTQNILSDLELVQAHGLRV